jgi:hypothetical protein
VHSEVTLGERLSTEGLADPLRPVQRRDAQLAPSRLCQSIPIVTLATDSKVDREMLCLPGSNLQAASSIKKTIFGSLSIGDFNAAIKLGHNRRKEI